MADEPDTGSVPPPVSPAETPARPEDEGDPLFRALPRRRPINLTRIGAGTGAGAFLTLVALSYGPILGGEKGMWLALLAVVGIPGVLSWRRHRGFALGLMTGASLLGLVWAFVMAAARWRRF